MGGRGDTAAGGACLFGPMLTTVLTIYLRIWCLPPALHPGEPSPQMVPHRMPTRLQKPLEFQSCQASPTRGLRQDTSSLSSFSLVQNGKCWGRRDPPPPAGLLAQDNPGWLSPNTNSSQVQKGQIRTPPSPCPLCHPQPLPGTSCAPG